MNKSTDLNDYYNFRGLLVQALRTNLLGPSEECETISDRPSARYTCGILYPQNKGNILPEEYKDEADQDDEYTFSDPPVSLANVRYPSSMGLTCSVDGASASAITVHVKSARYTPADDHTKADAAILSEDVVEPSSYRTVPPAEDGERWQRIPLTADPVHLDPGRPLTGRVTLTIEGLTLYYRVREADKSGFVPVTVVVVNDNTVPADRTRTDIQSFFQTEVVLRAAKTGIGVFAERPVDNRSTGDRDLQNYKLLYRHSRDFAVGHGCSVRWTTDPSDDARALELATTYIPEYRLPLSDSNPDVEVRAMEMKFLAEGERKEVISELREFCSGYDRWITRLRGEIEDLKGEYRRTAEGNLTYCIECSERIKRGTVLLEEGVEDDNRAWKAFRYMSRALLMQRARKAWQEEGRPGSGPSEDSSHRWRPFQIAFILLCLESIVNKDSAERQLADLLWFPTGGGKTEAYLGLIAFTTFLRRLEREDGAGVTVLMRYTLRLVTIQQFERAALLICCCEELRRRSSELGGEELSIGLWLGQDATPNTRSDARKALQQLRAGTDLEKGNPVQLHSCPWCGAHLTHTNYFLSATPEHLTVACKQKDCPYKGGLPVHLIDEDIYDFRPTLIISTVDKFASLPWREESATLFNLEYEGRKAQAPPELIIQDELHLISGPLGTLTGLYETILDIVCEREGNRPKVVASTATIRRASGQTKGLFNRGIRQFPPSGLDSRDCYFAVEAPTDRKGDRLYLGLMTTGNSQTTLLIRTAAVLMQSVLQSSAADEVRDPYWTLVAYFNSLRLLGAAVNQFRDDVSYFINYLAAQTGTRARTKENEIELTSRRNSREIPEHLRRMALKWPSPDALDYVLATNMISVGVDIDRLGLMVVMGQPQSTSEYIQSTSRVGRKHPGLIVVLLNSAKSRDRSHYESFTAYHSAIYRQVEATSVTPFSSRSRDRGLHAVLVALARILLPSLRDNGSAVNVSSCRPHLEGMIDAVVSRVDSVDAKEGINARIHLTEILERWIEEASAGTLAYRGASRKVRALLVDASESGDRSALGAFPTQWSLRDVDAESNLYLI